MEYKIKDLNLRVAGMELKAQTFQISYFDNGVDVDVDVKVGTEEYERLGQRVGAIETLHIPMNDDAWSTECWIQSISTLNAGVCRISCRVRPETLPKTSVVSNINLDQYGQLMLEKYECSVCNVTGALTLYGYPVHYMDDKGTRRGEYYVEEDGCAADLDNQDPGPFLPWDDIDE